MTTEAQLLEWKRSWRKLLSESLGRAFDRIEEQLPPGSPKADSLLLLKAQLNEANRAKVMGVKSSEDLQLDYNRIRLNLLEWIDALQITDFNTQKEGLKPKGSGVLLHKIPRQMEVGKEEVCIIRLAYDRAVIADNLELTDAVEVKTVKVSEVMEAELIDTNSQPAFHIRTYHDERQFLEAGAYTEWKFYVEPIREGTFRLLLKLTVIEEVMGAREHRNITWEEQVQIVTDAEENVLATFIAPGIVLSAQDTATPKTTTSRGVMPGAPTASRSDKKDKSELWEEAVPQAPVQPSLNPAPARSKRLSLARRLSIAASIVLIIGFGGLYLISSQHFSRETANPGSDASEQEQPAVTEPTAPVRIPAGVQFLGSLAGRQLASAAVPPPNPLSATGVFEVCVAPSGVVTEVTPVKQQANDRGWTRQMVRSIETWIFEPAAEKTCGSIVYRPE